MRGGGKKGVLVVVVKGIEMSPTAYSDVTATYRLLSSSRTDHVLTLPSFSLCA